MRHRKGLSGWRRLQRAGSGDGAELTCSVTLKDTGREGYACREVFLSFDAYSAASSVLGGGDRFGHLFDLLSDGGCSGCAVRVEKTQG